MELPPTRGLHHPMLTFLTALLLLTAPITSSDSQPNPIHALYPTLPTGTLNLTISVHPIPLALAHSLLPAPYTFLPPKTYLPLLPKTWDPQTYPLTIETRFDHDIYFDNIPGAVPDFQAISIFFPFVDRLGDGYSSFVYVNWMLVSWDVAVAIEGAEAYGEKVAKTRFVPDLEAFEGCGEGGIVQGFIEGVEGNGFNELAAEVRFIDDDRERAGLALDFYKNITNQPLFSNNASICDNQIILYNTTLSTGPNAPVPIVSDIFIKHPFFPGGLSQTNVEGIRVDISWIEKNFLDCETLKGYTSDGNGD